MPYFKEVDIVCKVLSIRVLSVINFSFPCTGTTWMSYILDLMYFKKDTERENSQPIFERVPFLELAIPNYSTGLFALRPDATTLRFTPIFTPL